MPLLSIITTVYDRAECLASNLRSVANLDWQDYEHIIVADHPPEDSFEGLERVVAEAGDARIHLFNLPERTNDFGISPARLGIQRTQGKYVAFLDDDNGYLPSHFNALIACLEGNPGIGLVYSACLWNAELLLNTPSPAEGRIDLGQVLFRRELFREQLNDELNYSGYTWDWQLIRDFLSRGAHFRFIDQETFIFRLDQYPRLGPEAPLESARKRIDELVRTLQHARGEFAEARSQAQDEIVKLRMHAERREQQHVEYADKIAALEATAERLKQQRIECEGEIVALRDAVERLEQERIEGETKVSALTKTVVVLESQLDNSQLEIRQLKQSRSWRITAPLRAILNLLLAIDRRA